MTEYLILIATMLIIYFVLVRNKPRPKSDWETLPIQSDYQKNKKSKNTHKAICCIHCGHDEIIKKPLKDKKENPEHKKFYHTCSKCRVILWRSSV